MSYKYINRIGLELESGWKTKRGDIHKDDSLKSDQFYNSACYGELVSEPLEDETQVIKWLQDAYSDISETPVCCAFHIHVSFKHINYYAQCMSKDFFSKFLQHMEQWAKDYPIRNDAFWDRLRGKNRYCIPEYRGDKQSICKTKDEARENHLRQTMLNYCFGLYKTLENRLFPTFVTCHAAIEATKSYLNFIESYLDKNPVSQDEILFEIADEQEFQKPEKPSKDGEIKLKKFNLYNIKKERKLKEYEYRMRYNAILEGKPTKTKYEISKELKNKLQGFGSDEIMEAMESGGRVPEGIATGRIVESIKTL